MSGRHLPEELWPEILSRVPVKTLLRFRCVSKQWRTLIDDPGFARSHLRLFNMNRCETHLIVYRPEGPLRQSKVGVRSAQSLKFISRFHIPETIIGSQKQWDYWCPVSSIDGLFMLKRRTVLRWSPPELMLWNPATRKTLTLPPVPQISTTLHDLHVMDLILGFDPSVNDYKHVRLVQSPPHSTSGLHSVAIYSLATNTWKITRDDQGIIQRLRMPSYMDDTPTGLCLRGFLFQLAAVNRSGFVIKVLVSFDFRSEKLAYIKLPVEDDDHDVAPYCLMSPGLTVADDGCLLVVVLRSYGSTLVTGPNVTIWALEGLGDDGINSCNWSKRYKISDFNGKKDIWGSFFCLLKNSELLIQWGEKITSYNLKTNKEKFLIKLKSDVKALPYIESLVAIS